jgi:hypothetical protein
MEKRIKFWGLCLLLGISLTGFALTNGNVTDLQEKAADFSGKLAESLPFNSTLGLNWSDAFIGKLFPSVPPHFGAGVGLGFTTIPMSGMKGIANLAGVGANLPSMDKLIMPVYTVEARLGGLFLPFDVGVKFGYLALDSIPLIDVSLDYMLAGADIRYAVLEGGIVLPKIILGVGFNYLKGGVGIEGNQTPIEFTYGTSDSFSLEKSRLGFEWGTKSLDFKAQISKSLFIVTPYAGLGLSYAWSNAGYRLTSKVTRNGNPIGQSDINAINAALKEAGRESMDVTPDGISSIIENSDLSFRAFGGISLNLAVFKIDLTGLYSFMDGNYGLSLGFRFQL